MKVFRRNEGLGIPYKMLLKALGRICSDGSKESNLLTTFFRDPTLGRQTMHYNELKIRILNLFESGRVLDSLKIRELLSHEKTLTSTDKAVEMALMRYWRQGLLSRNRRAGVFQYSLTERGLARREWLEKNR